MKTTALLIPMLVWSMYSFSQSPDKRLQQFASAKTGTQLSYKIISSWKETWGYDIYNTGKLYIHQPTIPALPGNTGFTTKEAAEKVAKKVIEKIRKGESLPTITIDDMKQLGVTPKQ